MLPWDTKPQWDTVATEPQLDTVQWDTVPIRNTMPQEDTVPLWDTVPLRDTVPLWDTVPLRDRRTHTAC